MGNFQFAHFFRLGLKSFYSEWALLLLFGQNRNRPKQNQNPTMTTSTQKENYTPFTIFLHISIMLSLSLSAATAEYSASSLITSQYFLLSEAAIMVGVQRVAATFLAVTV